MISVLMVCHGNICRSPMAEAVFRHMVEQAGLSDKITVDSAGTSGYHEGETAHPRTLEVLKKNNIPYEGYSRPLVRTDLQKFDYVVAMDEDNLYGIEKFSAGATAYFGLFLNDAYAKGTVNVREVPDPYYNGQYEETYTLVVPGCEALLARIRQDHHL